MELLSFPLPCPPFVLSPVLLSLFCSSPRHLHGNTTLLETVTTPLQA